jgi:hypothetical protein
MKGRLMTLATNPREAARHWIAETITKHLKPELGDAERVRHIANEIEATAFQANMPVELAVELTAEWCDEQNKEVELSQKGFGTAKVFSFRIADHSPGAKQMRGWA